MVSFYFYVDLYFLEAVRSLSGFNTYFIFCRSCLPNKGFLHKLPCIISVGIPVTEKEGALCCGYFWVLPFPWKALGWSLESLCFVQAMVRLRTEVEEPKLSTENY